MTIHQNVKRAAALPILAALILSLSGCSLLPKKPVSGSCFVLNTAATVTLYEGGDEALIDSCFDLCREYEALLSRTLPSSEISLLNSRQTSTVSPDTAELLQLGLKYCALSGGALDISSEPITSLWDFSSDTHVIPEAAALSAAAEKVDYRNVSVDGQQVSFASPDTRLDLGAVAKGFIADKMKAFLLENGVKSAIINLGGNVLCVGEKPDGSSFKVAIVRPFGDGSIANIEVSDASVVTSGVYERCFEEDGVLYHHILDTGTGYPVNNGLLSVTIVSPASADGDALSTACFALGLEDGMALIDSLDGTYALFITDDYKLHFSSGFEEAYRIEY